MNANMNKKMERGKLLAAAVAIIMIACCITVLATSADADEAPVYQVASTPGEGQYSDIPSAIAAADEAGVAAFTVQLMDDVTGAGFVVESGQNITIDLNGYKYTINSYVGSPGTETNGMQLLQGSTVTIINGSLALATQTAGWVIQNYCDLTLENVKIDGANSGGYALSNNCGNVVLKGETDIIAPADGVAFDVCGFSSYSGVTVTIDESFTGTIDGKIEMTKDAGNNGGVALNINADVEIENLDVQAGDVTVGNGATVTVQEATIADGASLTNNGTLVNNGTVTNNGTLTNNGNLLGEEVVGDVKYKDGTTMQIGDYVYNIFVDTLTLGDKSVVTFAYGIMVPAITFDGQPVEVQDVEPEVIPLTVSVAGATTKLSSYSATFDATLSSIIPEENDGSTGSYQMRVAINLIAESDAQKVNKYVYNIVDFVVEGAKPVIEDLSMIGWNVNVPGAADKAKPTFTYTGVGGESYDETTFPGEVKYTLTLDDDSYAQADWGEIKTAGEYTLTAEFPAIGNNKAVTETCTVTITSGTEVSPFVPGDVEEQYVDDLMGMKVSDIQNQIVFSDVESEENTIVATGMVHFIPSFEAFWGGAENDKAGYYLAFTLNEGYAIDWSEVTITLVSDNGTKYFGPEAANGALTDGTFILYIGDDAENLSASFEFTIDIDGDGTLYTPSTYTIVTSVAGDDTVGLEPFSYIIVYVDSKNNTILYDEAAEGAKYLIPYNGAGVGFNGWTTEVTDGDAPRNYNYASVMIVSSDLDVDMDGTITLTASYGETSVGPSEPTDPASEVLIFIGSAKGGVNVMLYGIDGYIPAGATVTVTYSYIMTVNGINYSVPVSMSAIVVENSENSDAILLNVDLTGEENYSTINSVYATLSIDGENTITDTISYESA